MDRKEALALVAAGCVAAAAAPASAQAAPIRVGTALNDPYMEPIYAREQGFFRRAGLDVTIQPLTNGAAIMQAAAGGAVDVALGELTQLTNAVDHGVPFGIFAGGAYYTTKEPTQVLCVAKSSAVRAAKELEGQTVGVVTSRSVNAISVMEWFTRNGVDLAKIRFFEIPYPEMPGALARGTLAAALVGEPYLTEAKADLRWLADTFSSVAPAFYIGCWYANRDWLARNTDAARRFADAVYATARWANSHRAESAAIEAAFTKVELDSVRRMARNQFSTSLDAKLMQPVLDVAWKYKIIGKPATAADLVFKLA
jgi:NitT/TauT family transport system substrate-binding protein